MQNTQAYNNTISMYHYIRSSKDPYPKLKHIKLSNFKKQIDYLNKNYKIISMSEYLELKEEKYKIPNNTLILTFDDGLKDHYKNVFPYLKKRELTGVFFPCTQPFSEFKASNVHKTHYLIAKMGVKKLSDEVNNKLKTNYKELVDDFYIHSNYKKENRYRWDDNLTANLKTSLSTLPVQVKKSLLNSIFLKYFGDERKFCRNIYMNTEEIKEMIEEDMEFGSHTHSHPRLTSLSKNLQKHEIKKSIEIFRQKIGYILKYISYPNSEYNDDTISVLKKYGFICGLTTQPGINKDDTNLFELKRIDAVTLPYAKNGEI